MLPVGRGPALRSTLGALGGEVIERLVPVLGPTVLVDHQQRKWRLRPVGGHKEPGGVDVLLDAAGGQTRDQAVGAVREGGQAIFLVGAPAQLGRAWWVSPSTPTSVGRC